MIFWEWWIIGTSVECIYGVICMFVHMHVFGWNLKTHFGPQGGVRLLVKIYNLFSRYLEGF